MTVGLLSQRRVGNVALATPAEVHLFLIWGRSLGRVVSRRGPVLYSVIHSYYMAITRDKKQTILSKLDGVKTDAASIVFVKFNGMAVTDSTKMRADLRDQGVGYYVAKKTLMKRAFDGQFEGELPALEGEIALAYSADAIAPAQSIKEYTTKYKNNLAIVGGVFQGVYKNAEEMTEIASIPALPVLRGMFVNVINSPIQGLVLGLNAIAGKKSA